MLDATSRQEAAPPSEPAAEAPEPAPPKPRASEAADRKAPAAKKPAAAKPAAAGGRPSVAEMMAAARAKRGAGEAPADKTAPCRSRQRSPRRKESPAAKPAAKPVANEAAAKAAGQSRKRRRPPAFWRRRQKEHKPGPMSKAEAAAKPAAGPARGASREARPRPSGPLVPPMPVKPEYAKPKPRSRSSRRARTFLAACAGLWSVRRWPSVFRPSMATTLGLWTLGTARFMFPNILTEPPSKFKVGFPSNFAPGQVETRVRGPIRRVGGELGVQRRSGRFTPCARCARTWAARRTGWRASRNSSAPATAAAFIRMASISRGRPLGRWSAMPFTWPTTASWRSTRASFFRKRWANGPIPLRSCRCSWWPSVASACRMAVDRLAVPRRRKCAPALGSALNRGDGDASGVFRMQNLRRRCWLVQHCRYRIAAAPLTHYGTIASRWPSAKSFASRRSGRASSGTPPQDRRNRIVVMLTNFFLHLHPVSVKKQGIALSYTWCMGGMTFFLFLVETVTGVLLMFYYRPTLEWAYNDILALRDVTSLGILRELHRWGAHAMVITVWLHMYRVFLTGSYKPPREFNWVRRRHPAAADPAAVVHRLPAAVGPVGDLGHHRRLQHGPGHAVPGARRARAAVADRRRHRPDHQRLGCALRACWVAASWAKKR